jgi:hypothetical protein
MSDKIAYVLNERGNLVPIMLSIETRDDTDYILEKELMFLTNLEIPCPEAQNFGQGVSVGYALKTMTDVRDKKAEVDAINKETLETLGLLDNGSV